MLADLELLSAGATRFLEQAVVATRNRGCEVQVIAPANCVAYRVLTTIRVLLGPRAHFLPIQTTAAHGPVVVPEM